MKEHRNCCWVDDPPGDFRSKMVEADVLVRLVSWLQDDHIKWLSIKSIIALAQFRRLMYCFVLCKD
jgi:hypothetical protein